MSYITPTCEIFSFEREDVITTSMQTPVIPFGIDDESTVVDEVGWF